MPDKTAKTQGFPPRAVLQSLFLHVLLFAAWEPELPLVAPPPVLHARLAPAERAAAAPASPSRPLSGARAKRAVERAEAASADSSVARPARAVIASATLPAADRTGGEERAVPAAPTFRGEPAPGGTPSFPPAPPSRGEATEARLSPAAGTDAAGLRQYRLALAAEARRYRRYPDAARRAGLGGTAEVAIAVAAEGSVRRVELSRSSGQAALDAAAVEMMRLAAERAEVPAALRGRDFAVHLPVIFEVEE